VTGTRARSGDEQLLDRLQCESFRFFAEQYNPANGLVRDSTEPGKPSSIAVVGFALSCYPIAVERGWMSRAEAVARTLAALRYFRHADQGGAADGVGHRGFFYHFLDMDSGRRAWNSELSTIDTTLLVAGMLLAARYFSGEDRDAREIATLTREIYERIDWRWAQNGGASVSMGWTPEAGFIPCRWIGYAEALILYALALGSPTHGIGREAYAEWLTGYRWKRIYGLAHVYAGPLFIHQFSHLWIDFRGIVDDYMAARGIDYFENSRRATCVHYEYGRRNPRHFKDYHGRSWGWTASDGPGPAIKEVHGRQRRFHGYLARGAPYGPDDGTVAPWASIASLPFAPELVAPTLRHFTDETSKPHNSHGFYASFNPTFHAATGDDGWVSQWHFGLNQGPIVLMVENYRNGLVWRLMRECEPLVRGLIRAGFRGGWLGSAG
jgi:hypothetical protein